MKTPILRKIFTSLEVGNELSPEVTALKKSLYEKAVEVCIDSEGLEAIDNIAADLMNESRYMGFVQGFAFARSLLSEHFI